MRMQKIIKIEHLVLRYCHFLYFVLGCFLSSCFTSVLTLRCHRSSGLLRRSQPITLWQCSFTRPKCALPSSTEPCHVRYLLSHTLTAQQRSEASAQNPSPEPSGSPSRRHCWPPISNLLFVIGRRSCQLICILYFLFLKSAEAYYAMAMKCMELWSGILLSMDLHNGYP